MADFHVQLALDYFRGKNLVDRTQTTLTALVTHVATAYQLSPDETQTVQETALLLAQRLRLLRDEPSTGHPRGAPGRPYGD
jgi:hypothetical protein